MKRLFACAAVLVLLVRHAGAEAGLLVVTSDFQTGSIALLEPGASQARTGLLTIHSDAVARFHQGRIYVINRLGQDNVLVLDPAALGQPLLQFSVGNGANPQDIEFAGPEKAYITRHNSTGLLVVDPRSGAISGEIDLGGFADGDGLPEMAEMVLVGDRLYVACQRLDRDAGWVASESYLVAIDTRIDQVVDWDPAAEGVQALSLEGANPSTVIAMGRRLFLGQTGQFGVMDGGIEVVDLDAGRSLGLAVSEAELQGDITALALVSAERGYAVVSGADFSNSVRAVDLKTGRAGSPLEGHSGGYTPDIEVDGERLIVADQGTFADPARAGLLIYAADSGQLRAGPISVGLPPLHIAVLAEAPVTAVEEGTTLPGQAHLGEAYPNPFNANTLIPFAIEEGGAPVRLVVYDSLGRRVRQLVAETLPAGRHAIQWDGRSDQGFQMGSGAYFAELRIGPWRASRKLLLLK